MFQVNLTTAEYEILKEYRNPAKWGDWQELDKKLRYTLQRMIVGMPGGKEIVLQIAKEASHNLGHCRWCTSDDHAIGLDKVAEAVFK